MKKASPAETPIFFQIEQQNDITGTTWEHGHLLTIQEDQKSQREIANEKRQYPACISQS